ncbi:MAG: trehalase family glycosidase, partial [Lentisphaerota bacterium]
METTPFTQAAREEILRSFRQTHPDLLIAPPLLEKAVDHLASCVQAPSGVFSSRWCSSEPGGNPVLNNNLLLPLVLAWCRLDPAVAADQVRSALDSRQKDGLIPSVCSPDGQVSAQAAWPLIVQSVECVWEHTRDQDLLTHSLPILQLYLERALEYFDPTGMENPAWQSREESFIPDIFESGMIPVDLNVFLICELAAFIRLCREVPGHEQSTEFLADEYVKMTEHLQQFFWDSTVQRYCDRLPDGSSSQRITLSCLMPLLYDLLPIERKNDLRDLLSSPRKFGAKQGLPAWLPWKDDAVKPPVVSLHQIIILEALRRAGLAFESGELRKELAQALLKLPSHPSNADASPDRNSRSTLGEGPGERTATAALTILLPLSSESGQNTARQIPPFLKTLDRHRVSFAALLSAMALLLVLAGIYVYNKQQSSLPRQSIETMSGLARQQYQEGNYDEAIQLAESLVQGSKTTTYLYFLIGNA